MEDLTGLVLDDDELSQIRTRRPGRCRLKLSAGEMTQLRDATAGAEGDWKPAVQDAFRRAVLGRVQAYLAGGHVAAYDDQQSPVSPAARFATILEHSVFLTDHLPRLVEHLRDYRSAVDPAAESFVYWSKERLASKAIISVTHVSIVRGYDPDLPDVLD